MTIITSVWADEFDGTPRRFLHEQVAAMPPVERNPVHTDKGWRTSKELHEDDFVVEAVKVGGRKRFDLRRVSGSNNATTPTMAVVVAGIVFSDDASGFGHRVDNFLPYALRKVHGFGNRSTAAAELSVDELTGGLLHAEKYYVDQVFTNGRPRFDLRPTGDRA